MNKTTIAEAFEEVPESLQEYIKSKEFEKDILQLINAVGLPVTAFLPLKNYTLLVLLNLSGDDALVMNLASSLQVDEKKVLVILEKVDELTLAVLQQMIDNSSPETVKNIKLPADASSGGDLRASMLKAKEIPSAPVSNKLVSSSRSMLMDQLSLIGQIPKDEDVLLRLSKIREQLRKGQEAREKLDEEIKERVLVEKIKSAEQVKAHVTRKVYDIDPYRENYEVEDNEL
jgi:hypothetical protein